jgi:hypothetical protein
LTAATIRIINTYFRLQAWGWPSRIFSEARLQNPTRKRKTGIVMQAAEVRMTPPGLEGHAG